MRLQVLSCALIAGLAGTAPCLGDPLPGVWFLDAGADGQRRLAVGGTAQEPPRSATQVCLGWTWSDPELEVDLYPPEAGGVALESAVTWSLTAAGATVEPEACPPAVAFPRLGIGPAAELWLLAEAGEDVASETGQDDVAPEARPRDVAPEARPRDVAPEAGQGGATPEAGREEPIPPARRSGWSDLLHAVEAFWRRAAPSPLAEMTIGSLERCTVRSLPVDLGTELDRWSPLELAARTLEDRDGAAGGNGLIRARRFLWWVEPPAAGESCAAASERGTLHLFPVTAGASGNTATGGTPAANLLTVAGVEWQRLPFSALDADDWGPRSRRLLPGPPAGGGPQAGREVAIPEPRRNLEGGDLCTVAGIDELCARNLRARRQLYTVLEPETGAPPSDAPWSDGRREQTRQACQAVLGEIAAHPAACETPELWRRPIAGGLVAGFTGDLLISPSAIRETWRDGTVEWRLDAGAAAATPTLELRLLDGDRVRIASRDLLGDPRGRMAPWQWWALGAGVLMAAAALASWSLAHRRAAPRPAAGAAQLESMIEDAVDRRLKALRPVTPPSSEPSREALDELVRRLVAAEIDARLESAAAGFERQAAEHEQRLGGVARELGERLGEQTAALGDELKGALRQEAQSLSEGLRQDSGSGTSPFHRLVGELSELPDDEREPLAAALAAAGQLGDWIDRLWPVLQAASDIDLEMIPQRLPSPAAGEWRRAVQTLQAFHQAGAGALRRLALEAAGERSGSPPTAADLAFLEDSGLLAAERPLAERLKRYLEPFDRLGRLGEVTLALQYLVEAYPIEQLSKDRRARFRRELSAATHGAGLEDDFHLLVGRIAAGVGLRYRPVRCYKSRTDQSESAFVRQQVSPISLSERVGFEATADKALIVRLERPFFFQLKTGIYHAGHAHVARG